MGRFAGTVGSDGERTPAAEAARAVADQVPAGIFELDGAGGLVFANARWGELTGLPPDLAVDPAWRAGVPPERGGALLAAFAAAAGADESTEGVELVVRHDGGRVWLGWTLARARPVAGEEQGWIGSVADVTGAVEAREVLADSERRFRSLAASAPVGIFETNPSGDSIYVNARWCELAGLTPAEARGRGWLRAIHPDDREATIDAWSRAVAADRELRHECRFRTPDGTVRHVLVTAVAQRGPDGLPVGQLGTVSDLTAVREAEERASRSEREMEVLGRSAPVGIARLDAEMRCRSANARFAQLIGRPLEEVVGRTLEHVIHPDDLSLTLDTLRALQRGGEHRGEHRVVTPDGVVRYLLVTAVPLPPEHGGDADLLVTLVDVDARRAAEARLAASEAQLRSLVSALGEGVVVHRTDGTITMANLAAERILGLTADQICGRTLLAPTWRTVREDGSPFPGTEHPAMVTLATGVPQRGTIMGVHRPGGDVAWIEANSEPIGDPVESVVVTFADVTHRVQRLREQEAQRAVATAVASGVSADEAFATIARAAGRVLDADTAGVARLHPAEDAAELVGAWSGVDPTMVAGRRFAISAEPVLLTLQHLLSPARAGSPRLGYPDIVVAPVVIEGALWGLVGVGWLERRAAPDGAEDCLTRFAELVALAITTAEARDRLDRSAVADRTALVVRHRRRFVDRVEREIDAARAGGHGLALVVLGIEGIEAVARGQGREAVDEAMHELARRVQHRAGPGHEVAWVADGQVAWLLPVSTRADAEAALAAIRGDVAALPCPIAGPLRAAAGLALLADGDDAASLIERAGADLLHAGPG